MVALLVFIPFATVNSNDGATFAARCLWVTRNEITTPRAVEKVITFAAANGFNHLLVQVRGRGDAYYNSTFVPKGQLLQDPSFDPLAYILELAHLYNIRIHAWVNVYLLWSAKAKPEDSRHLLLQKPDWIDMKNAGLIPLEEMLAANDSSGDGFEGLYLAPHHPEVNAYLLDVFRELVENYAVDGLHFDYLRYQDAEYGNNPLGRRLYSKLNGDDPLVLLSTRNNIGKQDPQLIEKINKWCDYRRYAVTELVKQTRRLLDEVRPGCLLSAAVKPNLYQARDRFYQEWDVWLAAGYLDLAFPMNYTRSLRQFAGNIEVIYDNLPRKYRNKIIMGIATYNQPAWDVVDKISYSRTTFFPGVCFFSYTTFRENPGYFIPVYKALHP